MRLHHRCDGIGVSAVSKKAESLGGAPLQDRLRILERGEEGGAGRALPNQAEGERRHLPHLDLAILEQTRQRLHALSQADAADRQRRATTDAALVVAQQANEIGRSRGSDDGRLALGGGSQHHLGRRVRIAKESLILEANDPAQFFFPGDDDRNGRSVARPWHSRWR